ncbi:hypothetical protein ACFFVB_11075 [Formosa undariae]|uniref:M6 family metalloprotease domain-containing protein n=1 Tax=Formosa undariae TaxID=1325436 RepID=A0ABV5F2E2_9FLAO
MKNSVLKTALYALASKTFKLVTVLCIALLATSLHAQKQYRGITVYIDYSDLPRPENETPERLESLLNDLEYSEANIHRSVCKYWYEQSFGEVLLKHDIFYYRAPLPASHYAELNYKEGILLWKEALEHVVANNPDYDWNRLSTDTDGNLRSVMFYNSDNFVSWIAAAHHGGWTLANGVKTKSVYGSYLIRNGEPSLFTPIHESGHAFFRFPDTYDTGYDSGGAGAYTVMSGGKTSLIEPVGAPFRVEKNWGRVIKIAPKPGTQTFTLKADGDAVVVYKNPLDDKEYFSIEARKQSTLGNEKFPVDLGLLFWHTDLNVKTSNKEQGMTPEKHYKHAIVQADGLFELERGPAKPTNRGNAGDIYVPGKSFNDTSLPNSKWWDGTSSHLEITNIRFIEEDQIRFDVIFPKVTPKSTTKDKI